MSKPRYSVTVQLTQAEFDALNLLVQTRGLNKSALLRCLVLEAAAASRTVPQ